MASAAIAVVLALGAAPGRAEVSAIVYGAGQVGYEVRATATSYRNSGFAQDADGRTVRVTVDLRPERWTRQRYPGPPTTARDGIGEFAARAASGASTRAEAVARVLHAIAARVEYRTDGDVPSEPSEVLAAGRGHCVGRSNLAVAALTRLDIEARIVRGALIDPGTGSVLAHRWIEVYYADAGWVFSDPTESINYVSPYHLVLTPPAEPAADYSPEVVGELEPRIVTHSVGLMTVDEHPSRASLLAERRSAHAQFAAAVVGRIVPELGGTVTLHGPGGRRRLALQPGQPFAFPGLEPGAYQVEAVRDGLHTVTQLRLSDGQLQSIEVALP